MTKKATDATAKTVSFDFENGKVSVFDLSKVSPEILNRLALHGASQKIGDSYAGAGDESDPVAYAEAAANDVIAQLYAGDWRVTATGGPRVSDLAQAISQLSGQTVEAVTAGLNKATDEAKKKLRKQPKIAAQLAQIKATNAAARAAKLAEAAGKVDESADAVPTFE